MCIRGINFKVAVRHFVPKTRIGKIIDYCKHTMFFKKKKIMNDNTKAGNENADNLSQNEEMDEALSNVLNVDDSRGGGQLDEGNDEEIEKYD